MPRTLDSTLRWNGVSDYIVVTAASAQSVAFSTHIHEVRVVCTSACHISFGVNPTAAATDNNAIALPAGVVEYFHVTPGQKLAVVRDSADGVLCMAEMTR